MHLAYVLNEHCSSISAANHPFSLCEFGITCDMTSNSKKIKIQSKLDECSQPLENLESGKLTIYACSYYILFGFIYLKKKILILHLR